MMKRLPILCAASVMSLLAGSTAAWADSEPTASPAPTGTSFASAANVVPGSGLHYTLSTSGDLGDLLDFLNPVVDQFTQPLADAVSTLPATMVADIADDIGQTSSATAAPVATNAPDDYPNCDDDTWSAGNCYHQSGVAANDNPIIAMRIGGADGWAATDGDGSSASARSTGITLSALGLSVATIGSVASTTTCASQGDCTNTGTFSDVSMLGGAVLAKSGTDGAPLVSLDSGSSWAGITDLGTTTVSGGGHTATVLAVGDSLEVSIAMTLQQLADAVGQSTDVSSLGAYDDGSSVTLDLFIGGADRGASNSRGPGLRLGIGIGADIKTSVFGLVDSELQIADSDGGNAADIAIAFTAATASSNDGSINDPVLLK